MCTYNVTNQLGSKYKELGVSFKGSFLLQKSGQVFANLNRFFTMPLALGAHVLKTL